MVQLMKSICKLNKFIFFMGILIMLLSADFKEKLKNEKLDIGLKQDRNSELRVAIIDTGIEISHEKLKDYVWINKNEKINGLDDDFNGYVDDINGWNFCENNEKIDSYHSNIKENSHGTACAGIILRQCRNKNIKIIVLKILDDNSDRRGTIQNLKKAIRYAESMNAKICNLSLGTYEYDKELFEIIDSSEMLFVVAAGSCLNRGRNISVQKVYPASFKSSNIITVTSVDEQYKLCKGSNYSSQDVDIAALGENVYTTSANNEYAYVSGTSFAAPMVTGMAVEIYDENLNISPQEAITKILKTTKKRSDLLEKVSGGRVLEMQNNFK